MYRTGWAARVLSGALVMILVLISTGAVVRYLRPDAGNGQTPGVEGALALDDLPAEEEGEVDDVPVQGGTDATPEPAPNPSSAAPTPPAATPAQPPASPSAARPTTTRPATTAPAPPPPAQPKPQPAATPYLTGSVSTYCRGGGSWAYNISGALHNASVGYDPHGYVDQGSGSSYGYPIDGDGSTRFSGSVPKSYGPGHDLTAASARWSLEVWVNGDMLTGTRISTSGTVSRPPGC
jgi:hypothetical protein